MKKTACIRENWHMTKRTCFAQDCMRTAIQHCLPSSDALHPTAIRRADRDNTIDVYISEDHDDVLANGVWQQFFTEKPEVLTREEKRAWLDTLKGVSLGSDAFFPFGDNIERAHKSGVDYIAQAGGSVRDDHVIETCDKYGIAMSFTGIRLFHH